MIFIILGSIGFKVIASAVFFVGTAISSFSAYQVKCPKCNTPVRAGHDLFSKYYKGSLLFVPKKCLKCGTELDGRPQSDKNEDDD